MKIIFPFVFLCIVAINCSAQNIVLNPDFELFSTCPTANGDLQKANNWLDVVYSSDYMNCAFQGWTTQAVAGAQNGLGYAGFATYGNANGAAESFGQFLATPLVAGSAYKISFYAKRSSSGFYSSICSGVCFYGFNGNPVAGGAQTNICTDQLVGATLLGCCDTVSDVNWLQYTIDFTAPANLDYIVITPGCAINCAEYIYIDNINFVQTINFANVCFGDTTLFFMNDTSSMVSSAWTFSDPGSGINNTSSLFNASHIFTSTGNFIVRVIRTYINTSVDTVIIPVTIYPQVNVNLGNDTTICQGQSITLNAAGAGITTFQWQDGSSASTYIANSTGVYFVMASNPGCNASDTMNLNVISCTSVTAQFQTVDPFICPGTCTDFTNLSLNATAYQWFFAGANPSSSTDANPSVICYNTPGSYDVTLIATDGTLIDTLILTNYISVYPYPSPQGISQSGDSLIANQGAVSYQWYHDGVLIPGATDYFYVQLQGGDFNVVATDANGCEAEAVIYDVIASVQATDGHPEAIILFPNPVIGNLEIRNLKLNSTGDISIYNMLGEKIYLPVNSDRMTVDCHTLPSGIYRIEVTSEKVFRAKFIKQ